MPKENVVVIALVGIILLGGIMALYIGGGQKATTPLIKEETKIPAPANGKTTQPAPPSSTPTSPSIEAPEVHWNVYRNIEWQFEFKYPSEFRLLETDSAKYPQGALFPPAFLTDSPIVRVGFPESYYQGTNLIEASLAVMIYPKERVGECLRGVYSGEELPEKKNINGIDFFTENLSEGGMGYRYEVRSYRTIRQGQCYAVNLVLYWTSLLKERRLSPFKKTEVLKTLDGILSTFRFIK